MPDLFFKKAESKLSWGLIFVAPKTNINSIYRAISGFLFFFSHTVQTSTDKHTYKLIETCISGGKLDPIAVLPGSE